jgi:hypothetical protein
MKRFVHPLLLILARIVETFIFVIVTMACQQPMVPS